MESDRLNRLIHWNFALSSWNGIGFRRGAAADFSFRDPPCRPLPKSDTTTTTTTTTTTPTITTTNDNNDINDDDDDDDNDTTNNYIILIF